MALPYATNLIMVICSSYLCLHFCLDVVFHTWAWMTRSHSWHIFWNLSKFPLAPWFFCDDERRVIIQGNTPWRWCLYGNGIAAKLKSKLFPLQAFERCVRRRHPCVAAAAVEVKSTVKAALVWMKSRLFLPKQHINYSTTTDSSLLENRRFIS